MNATLAMVLFSALLQATPTEVTVATISPGSRAELSLIPEGKVELRREPTLTRVQVELDRVDPLTTHRSDMRAFVVWAVSPEGEVENLGELEPDGRGAKLETVSSFSRLGIIVTAEPHFRVPSPSSWIGFRSGAARDRDVRVDTVAMTVGQIDYSAVSLPPQGSIHPRVSQARMAVAIAEGTGEGVNAALREARVALESLEQLLRRNTPLDVVLTYADDAIRLAELSTRQALKAADEGRLMAASEEARNLQAVLEQAQEDFSRAETREREATLRINGLLSELEAERESNRVLILERDSAVRDLSNARREINELQDPWPPLVSALVYNFAARETPRGLVLTLPADAFQRNAITDLTREWLARLSGVLSFRDVPEVWVEGHSRTDDDFAQSERRALEVRDFLVSTGLPDSQIHSQGMGTLAPIPGTEAGEGAELNERIEIIVRKFGSL